MIAILVMLVASLGWATFDAARKHLSDRIPPVALVVLLMLGQVPVFAIWLGFSVATHGAPAVHSDYLAPALLSIAINVVANLLFLRAVNLSPLSLTIPMLSFSPAFSALLAWLPPLHETLTRYQAAGAALVILGALTLNAAGVATDGPGGFIRRLRSERGVPIMLVVALLFSLSSAVDKVAQAASSPPLHALVQCLGVGLVLLVVLLRRGQLSQLRAVLDNQPAFAGAIAAGATALGFQMSAFVMSPVSTVETVKRAIGMTAAQVVGRIAFGEPLTARKWVAVGLMSLGCLLILGNF